MDITPEMIAAFRADPLMKAFIDETKWPDTMVAEALCEADTETGSPRWGAFELACCNFKWRGMKYFAAHWLATNFGSLGAGGTPNPEARLNVAEKSVGDESIAYRVPSMMNAGTDWLTYTNYGQQFYRLKKRAGMGAKAV
ncbi:DUF4054 domain-containing protein [Pseudomonas chlororaphis]|uniref:DUF4054 domain-containing protein n=1 Tax=Pseudomonas chlororaphis TaxID=587753 RepID=UPI0024083459|nr:DUF4054 domain-containing protein [Pseudomonas chlororaphis]